MADRKTSQLTALTTLAAGDYVPVVDVSEPDVAQKNKRIAMTQLLATLPIAVEDSVAPTPTPTGVGPFLNMLANLAKLFGGGANWHAPKFKGSGIAFPSTPAAGWHSFRTDLGWWCYYDGTRWLTCTEYSVPVSPWLAYADTTVVVTGKGRGDYAPFITRVSTGTDVIATNDGARYWTIAIRGANPAYAAFTTIWSFATNADTPSTWTLHEQSVGGLAAQAPANNAYFDINVTKTSTPGALYVVGEIFYRLIVT